MSNEMGFSSSWRFSALLFPLFVISTSLSLSFAQTNNVTLLGDASFRNGSISLTQEIACSFSSPSSSSCGSGRALCSSPIRFLDPVTKTAASFLSRFSFFVIPSYSSSSSSVYGDGLTFLITSSDGAPCNSAGHMGLLNCATNAKESFVAVEFDTNLDPSLGDLNDNHVAFDINSVVSFASVDAGTMGISLKSGRRMTAWIEYRDREKMVRVWLSYSTFRPAVPILNVGVDLSEHLQEFMHVGFSASNGRGSALHLIDKWQFKTSRFLNVTPTDKGQAEEEEEEEECCFTCSADDLAIDHGSTDPHKRRRRRRKINELGLALGGTAAFLFSMAVVVGGTSWYLLRKKKIQARGNKARQMCRIQMKKIPTRLSLAEIKAATKGFKQSRIVGEGASGTVYEGTLPSGGTVAVKRFNWRINPHECLRDPFMTELATMMGCLRHKNLVQLQGWCCEGDELVLVYEFMPCGSLNELLHHNKNSSASILTLEQRLKIVLGVASALTYLHEECDRQIIHRDIKACNIMLDAKLTPKLGDFGLAEVYEHSGRTRQAITPAGTIGYLAPEYVHSGLPTVKTDVYSFGVVVLEVVTGRLPVDEGGIVLMDWVWDMWAKGKLEEAGDERLMAMERLDKTVMVRMLMVGLSCVHPNCLERPTVREAVRMLRGEALLPDLPTRKPVVRFPSILPEGSEEILQCGDGGGDVTSGTPWATPRSHFS